ncbi:MAG: substrate-binding domain-containing protein [Chloroflexota bacterium]
MVVTPPRSRAADRPAAGLGGQAAAHRGPLHVRCRRRRRGRAARVAGLRVPDDLSVVGSTRLPLTRFTGPPLTTVHQPVRRKGEEAARLLLTALSAPSGEARPLHRILRTRLVVRHSTAPPPAGRRLEVVASA